MKQISEKKVHRSSRMRYLWITLLMLLAGSGVTLAGLLDGNVAKVGDNEYPTLQAAVNAAQQSGGEQTITLIGNVSGETVTIQEVANFKLTIDGQNKTVDATIAIDGLRGNNGGSTTNGASVTLQNIAFVKTTSTDGIQASHYPHHLTIQDCTYSGSNSDKWFFNASSDGPLYGVTIKNVTVEHARLIYANLADDAVFQNITATNDVTVGFNVKTSGTALIENCQITTGKYAFRDYSDGYEGTFTLKDNTFISTSTASDEGAIVNRGGAVGTAHINVESGTYVGALKINKQGVFSISGGQFSAPLGDEDYAGFIAEGTGVNALYEGEASNGIGTPIATVTIGEKVNNYAKFVAAAEVAGNENVITLLDNITDAYTMSEGQTLKVNKNGKTVTVNAPEGLIVNSTTADGVTTYTLSKAVAQIGTTKYETIAAAVAAANEGDLIEVLIADTYTLPNLPKNVTIQGTVEGVVFNHTTAGSVASVPNGATFKNVTFNFGNVNYNGFQHAGTINMEGCTLNGRLTSYGDMNFTNCQFTQSNSDYHMWNYSGNQTYTNCTFTNSATGKFLNVYNESGATKYTVTCTGCKFINNASAANKAAINVKATSGSNVLKYDVIINNCTTEGEFPEANWGDALVVLNNVAQVDDRTASGVDNITVTQDGELIYPKTVAKIGDTKYPTLQSAVNAAQQMGGDVTITLLDDISGETVTIQEVANFKVTIDGKKDANTNYTIDGQIIVDGLRGNGGSTTNGASVTLQNIAFVKTTATDGIQASHYPHNVTIQDCTYTGFNNDNWFFNASVDGPLYGVTIKNVTVETARLIYANLAEDAVFQNITATNDVKVGFNVKTSGTALIENCQVTTGKYAFRDYSDGYAGTFTLKNNTFISTSEESDEGVIVNRGGTVGTTHINVESGTYTGHLKVLNNKEGVLALSGGYFSEEFPQNYIAEDLVAQGKACVPATDKEGYYTIGDPHYVAQIGETKYVSLQAALDAAHEMTGDVTVELIDNIEGYSIARQKAGLNLTIDGKDKTLAGQIFVDGNGRLNDAETLTIQNIKFEGNTTNFYSGTDAFILIPSTKETGKPWTTGAYNYAHNITISNCSFNSTSTSGEYDIVCFKSTSAAGAKNVNIDNCTASGTKMHSLAQFTGTTGGSVTNCTVTGSESFMNVNGGAGEFTVSGNTFTSAEGADGYGIRENGSSTAVITLTDNDFTAANAVVLGKGDQVTAGTINVVSGTYTGEISKTTAATGNIVISDGHFSATVGDAKYAPFIAEGLSGVNGIYATETPNAPNGIGTAVATVTDSENNVSNYATLQSAIDSAADGNTVTLLTDINMGTTAVNINKGIILDGDGHTITSAATQAFFITGSGDVTIANTKVTASNGHGIQTGDDNNAYSGKLTVSEGTVLTVAKRGINVWNVADGFTLEVNGSTIQSNVEDPTTSFTTGNDARGINLIGTGYNVTLTNATVQGFAYNVNVPTSGTNLNVDITGGTYNGWSFINNWGSNNTFDVTGATTACTGLSTGDTNSFSTIIDNEGATNNAYTLTDCTFSTAPQGETVREDFLDLRGTNAIVKVLGSTTYTTSNDALSNFIYSEDELFTNKLYFDDTTKATFANAFEEAVIADEKDAEVNLYPVTFTPEVYYHWDNGAGGYDGVYCHFVDPFEDTVNYLLGDGEFIALQKDITLDHNVVNPLESGTLNFVFGDYTITKGDYSVKLKVGQSVNTDKQTDIFTAADANYKVVETGDAENGYVYTVEEKPDVAQIGDVKYKSLAEAVAAVPADGTETTITMIANEAIDVVGYAITIPATKNVVLDLNGFEVSGEATTGKTSALIRNQGSLKIQDSSDTNKDGTGTGKLTMSADPFWVYSEQDPGGYASNLIRNEKDLVVESGSLYNQSTGSACYAIDNYSAGNVTVNGGKVDAAKASAIRMFYVNGGSLTVNGGLIGHYTSDDDCTYMGIQVMSGSNANVTVTKGTVAGNYALYANNSGGNIDISGGTFDGYVGFAAAVPNLSISGGAYTCWVGTWGEQTKFISGGLFAEEVDDEAQIADGYIFTSNKDEATKEQYPYMVKLAAWVAQIGDVKYESLAEAVTAAQNGETIELLANITDETVVVNKELTIMKNGFTVENVTAGDGFLSEETMKKIVISPVVPVHPAEIVEGYFRIKNLGNDKYVNVIGRRSATVSTSEEEALSLAGTVIKVEAENGRVDILRSQAVDIPHYAERAMTYVPEFVNMMVEKLGVDGSGEILGSTGVDAIMQKFYDNFDYHLHVEYAHEGDTGIRIYGKTPSMLPVVEFYEENKDKVDAKLPRLEDAINEAINKVVDKLGRGESLRNSFDLHKVWEKMGNTSLTEPTDEATKVQFMQEVLADKDYVWSFGYQAVMIYVDKVENSSIFNEFPAEAKKYWNLAKQAHPDFKYYIVQKDGAMDIISEGNADILNDNARTKWILEPVNEFEVTFPEELVNEDGEYFTTLYTDFGYQLPSGVTALKVTGIDGEGIAQTEEIGNEVTAQIPVLLKSTAAGTVNLTVGNYGSAVSGNLLHGADYIVDKYEMNSSTAEGLFEFVAMASQSVADQYAYLQRLNSGTVGNKYFFPISQSQLDEVLGEDTPIHYLGVTDDGKLAFLKSWETLEANVAFMFDETIDPIYLDEPEYPADIAEGYYNIKNLGNESYVNVVGRRTATVNTTDTKGLAGTIIKVKATDGIVEILRSQAVDIPYYAQRAMSYVPDVVELVVNKLGVSGSGEILGENGVQAILDKFNEEFDYHLHVEYTNAEDTEKLRIYGKTPSMRPVVEFYKENKANVDYKLPGLEAAINEAIDKIVDKAGTGNVLRNSFKLKTIWERMGGALTNPDVDATKFLQEVLASEANVWNFAYQTATFYMEKVEGSSYFDQMPSELRQYWNLAKQVRPNFKYYIVQKDGKMDIISQGNGDILNDDLRTMWTLEPVTEFTVTVPETNSRLAGKDTKEYYTTIYTDFGYQLPEGATALKVTEIKDVTIGTGSDAESVGLAVTEEIGQGVAPQTPVMIKSTTAGEITLTIGDNYGSAVTGNLLHGTDWLINEFEINTPSLEGLFNIFKEISATTAEQYEYLLRRNSGTVNNKYFFPISAEDIAAGYKNKTGNEMEETPIRILDKNGKFLAFYDSWENLPSNAVFIYSEEYKPVFLYLIGDVTRDGLIDVRDVNATIDIVLGRDKPEDNYDYEAADLRKEYEKIQVQDVNKMIDLVLKRISLKSLIEEILNETNN